MTISNIYRNFCKIRIIRPIWKSELNYVYPSINVQQRNEKFLFESYNVYKKVTVNITMYNKNFTNIPCKYTNHSHLIKKFFLYNYILRILHECVNRQLPVCPRVKK